MTQVDDARYAELDATLRFETLLKTLSAALTLAEPADLDRQVEKALTEILDFFCADRCLLVGIDPDKGDAYVLHAAYAAAAEPLPVNLNLAERFPWLTARLRDPNTGGEAIYIARLADLPPEAGVDREAWAARGVKSNIVLPLRVGDRVRHVIVLHWIRAVHDQAERHIPRLRLLGETIVTTLERAHARREAEESQARLSLAAASAGAGMWDMDIATGEIWAAPEAKALYGFSPDHHVKWTEVLDRVHPEDRETVRTRLRVALQQRTAYSAEYRLLFPDGRIR
jgi:formate hydrogenlyase transcriptional activator